MTAPPAGSTAPATTAPSPAAARGEPLATVDVVVVGAGLAGCAAALAAAERGATVLLLEKGEQPGGSSVRAGGGLLFAGTSLQRRHGVADSPEALRAAIVAAGQDRGDPAAVDVYADNQLAAYEWMAGLGQEFILVPANADITIPRLHAAPPSALTALLLERLAATDRGRVVTGAAGGRLTTDGGRVTGVLVSQVGVERPVSARLGVILATGGFTQSPELLRTFAPQWADAAAMGGDGNTGDGLRMAMAVGAQLADMGYVAGTFGAAAVDYPGLGAAPGTAPRLLFPHAAGAIVVNRAGRRFVNEGLGYKVIAGVCAGQPDGIAFQVFDQPVMDTSVPVPSPRDFARALADGLLFQAPTLAALAERLRVDAAVLAGTVARYNAGLRAGADPEHGRPLSMARELTTPPYYGYPCRAGLTTTYCGVRVSRRLEVLDVFDQPIGGLFAAGEVVGGLHGAGYLTGTGLGKAAVYGRVAGLAAAAW